MKTTKSILHTWKAVWLITLVVAAFSMVACSKKSDSSRSAGVPVSPYGPGGIVAPTCQGCVGGGSFLATTDSQTGSIYLGLDWYAIGTMMAQPIGTVGAPMISPVYSQAGYMSPDKVGLAYTGQVQAGGRLQVAAQDMFLCNIPVGDYVVRTLNPGQWQMGTIKGAIRFEAIGTTTPIRVVFSLTDGALYDNAGQVGTTGVDRMFGHIMIEQVNNMACMGTAAVD